MNNNKSNSNSLYFQSFSNQNLQWWPWCEDAFTEAKKQNKAIFISVGYTTCQWCQKMQKEVFQDPECAKILQENFICIAIDKYERPDLDNYYQNLHTLLNNKTGGWPTSIFATPENKPFFAGTFIEKQSQAGSIEGMGFLELSQLIAKKVAAKDKELEKNVTEIEHFLTTVTHPKEATHLHANIYKNFLLQAENNFDKTNKGFGSAPKFLHPTTLLALLDIDKSHNEKRAKTLLNETILSMAQGEIYNRENGGFYHYTMEGDWTKPSSEQTLCDNAMMLLLYTKAAQRYKDKLYHHIAKKTADFIISLKVQNNLFSSQTTQENFLQTSWNAMAVTALFEFSKSNPAYLETAIKTLDTLLGLAYNSEEIFHTITANNTAEVNGFLEDYAFVIEAILQRYIQTNNETDLIKAQQLTNKTLELFFKQGVWYFSKNQPRVQAKIAQNNYPSAIAVMVENLLQISKLLQDEKYKTFAFTTLQYNSYEVARKPILYPSMFMAVLKFTQNNKENR